MRDESEFNFEICSARDAGSARANEGKDTVAASTCISSSGWLSDIVGVRLRPSFLVPSHMTDRSGRVLWGLPACEDGFSRQLTLTYLVRKSGLLEAAVELTTSSIGLHNNASEPLRFSKEGLMALAAAALPGFQPNKSRSPRLRGPSVPLHFPRLDLSVLLSDNVPSLRPAASSASAAAQPALFLPRGDTVQLDADEAVLSLIDCRVDADLSFRLSAVRFSADIIRVIAETKQRLISELYALGEAAAESVRIELALLRLERWLRAGGAWRIGATLQFRKNVDLAVAEVVASTLLGQPENRSSASSDIVDLSSCILASESLPSLALAKGTPRLAARLAQSRRCRRPKGFVLRLGKNETGQSVALSSDDLRQHLYVTGQSGTGKTTFLESLIRQDAAEGNPLCLIDPHGDLHAKLCGTLPADLLENAVIADVGNFDAPFSINVIDVQGPYAAIQRNFIVNQLIALFKSVYGNNKDAFGPIFEQFFRGSLLLLMDAGGPNATLVDLDRVFGDAAFRRDLLARCSDEVIVRFWKNIATRAHGDMALENIAPYIVSKVTQITSNALARPILCDPESSLDFSRVLDEGKIVLVNLAKGLVGGPDAALIGGIITIKLFAAAMARSRQPAGERRLTRVILDEFHTHATHVLGEAMAECRKFGLSLVLANQSIAQVDGRESDIAHAILANAGNLVSFRVGPNDAPRIAQWLGPEVSSDQLLQLPNHTCVARLLLDGAPLPPSLIKTSRSQPPIKRRVSRPNEIPF